MWTQLPPLCKRATAAPGWGYRAYFFVAWVGFKVQVVAAGSIEVLFWFLRNTNLDLIMSPCNYNVPVEGVPPTYCTSVSDAYSLWDIRQLAWQNVTSDSMGVCAVTKILCRLVVCLFWAVTRRLDRHWFRWPGWVHAITGRHFKHSHRWFACNDWQYSQKVH